MKRSPLFVACLLVVMIWLASCMTTPTAPTPTPPTATPDVATPTVDVPTPTVTTPDPGTDERGEESILILEPGNGSRVVSPVRVAGIADPTFEQSLVARLVLDDGSELALAPAQIEAELGQRGPFVVEVPFSITGERQAFIQVYASSARDGGTTHLASVGITIADAGAEDVVAVTPHPERIAIFEPQNADTISGGVAHVEGFALASFEQTLVIEVLDADGNVIASEPVIVEAPDLGQPGPFSADVPYRVTETGPGRIVVRDPSPAFGGDSHLASVEVTLEANGAYPAPQAYP